MSRRLAIDADVPMETSAAPPSRAARVSRTVSVPCGSVPANTRSEKPPDRSSSSAARMRVEARLGPDEVEAARVAPERAGDGVVAVDPGRRARRRRRRSGRRREGWRWLRLAAPRPRAVRAAVRRWAAPCRARRCPVATCSVVCASAGEWRRVRETLLDEGAEGGDGGRAFEADRKSGKKLYRT